MKITLPKPSFVRAMLRAAPALLASACAVGPNYVRPKVDTPPAFKEAPNAENGWVPSQPMDTINRGAWWSVFNDPILSSLEDKVAISNQTVAQALAAYTQARALTAADRASLFPTVSLTGAGDRSGGGGGGRSGTGTTTTTGAGGTTVVTTGGGSYTASSYSASLGATWAPDVWGRIRRQVQSDNAASQASAADLANAKLSAQTELATDYFDLRVLDEEKRLYDETVVDYQKSYAVSENQYKAGIIAKADLITAQTQLLSTQASAADVGVQRQQTEHAIAVLAGMAPSELTIAPTATPYTPAIPTPPIDLPSQLLQRRPDIASAERSAASASAAIGVQVAAYFPTITLSGSYGYNATNLSNLFASSNDVWSYGANVAETLLDFGARKARVKQAKAVYDQRVAAYRQTVLTAFQGVEDQLVALRVLEVESKIRDQELTSARLAQQLALNRYRAGQVDYTTVAAAQAQALTSAQNVLNLSRSRQDASVALIEALGGGWTTAYLPRH
jgi:NodT family efflux transporter outer membrane factor (OMF) lipoprotein